MPGGPEDQGPGILPGARKQGGPSEPSVQPPKPPQSISGKGQDSFRNLILARGEDGKKTFNESLVVRNKIGEFSRWKGQRSPRDTISPNKNGQEKINKEHPKNKSLINSRTNATMVNNESSLLRRFKTKADITLRYNKKAYIPKGAKVTKVRCIAEGDKVWVANRLNKKFGLNLDNKEWKKERGQTAVYVKGKREIREVHFYWNPKVGDVEYKFPSNEKQRGGKQDGE